VPQSTQLSEQYIQDRFHSHSKSPLTQAKIECLLDADILSSAEGGLMSALPAPSRSSQLIRTGPALPSLYLGALRSTTNPPSVPLPRTEKCTTNRIFDREVVP